MMKSTKALTFCDVLYHEASDKKYRLFANRSNSKELTCR